MPDQKTKFDDGTWKHEIRKISDLHPNPDNPRTITKKTLKGLKKSMEKNGYTHRIIIDHHNMILSGHARWLVFKEKDPTAEIEVLAAQRELTPEEIQNAVIGHNVDGSGSTMMACEQIGRKCYMNELDPHYCDVIIERWEQYTGKTATKIN